MLWLYLIMGRSTPLFWTCALVSCKVEYKVLNLIHDGRVSTMESKSWSPFSLITLDKILSLLLFEE